MPLIHKRRIWWEPVTGAKEYVVYVSLEEKPIDRATFSWGDTPSMISKLVVGKNELIIPDEWPEFPSHAGTYHIAVTSRNEVGNQSDPLFLSGVFNFIAPIAPTKGGIESVSTVKTPKKEAPPAPTPENITPIQREVKEKDPEKREETINTFIGQRLHPVDIHLRNTESQS